MNEPNFNTARKFFRETQSTTINPESNKHKLRNFDISLAGDNQKTESKRYKNNDEKQLNKTIDFSNFKTHRKTLSVGKQTEFHPLPEIKIAKNKRGAKKGTFLQIWLNEALDTGEDSGSQSYITNMNDQTLGALKSFNLDRKILKSKNISDETIQKIYKKLYVYSKGLGMAFEEINQLASQKSAYQDQKSWSDMNEVFWTAFNKLLQSETPFETSFRAIEKNYIKTINQLKEKMRKLSDEFDEMMNKNNDEIRRLSRELQMGATKYRQLENDHKIVKSTLQLTDKSLQEEIQLRLKFEEKINSVYTSYDQMKTKYMDLLQTLKLKNQQSSESQEADKQTKQKLQDQIIKSRQLQFLLNLQRQKVENLKAQIVIKAEEKVQLQTQILNITHNKQENSDQIHFQIRKVKMMEGLMDEAKTQKERLTILNEEQKLITQKLEKRINELSNLNNSLYEDKYRVYEQNQTFKQKNKSLRNELALKAYRIQHLQNQVAKLRENIKQLTSELEHEKSVLTDTAEKLQIKTELAQMSAQTIEKLKQVKDRYQRLHVLAQREKRFAVEQKIDIMAKMQQQEVIIQDLTKQTTQLKSEKDLITTRANKLKQIMTKKMSDLQQALDKKDTIILDHLKTIQKERIQILAKERQVKEVIQKLETKDLRIYKIDQMHLELKSRQPIVEDILTRREQELRDHAQSYLENLLRQSSFKNKIHEVQSLLNLKNTEVHIQIEAHRKLSAYYKKMYEQYKEYVHPMIYEDMLATSQRAYDKVNQLKNQIKRIQAEALQYKSKYQTTLKQKQGLKQGIQALKVKNMELTDCMNQLQTQNDKLLDQQKQNLDKIMYLTEGQKRLKQQLTVLKAQKQEVLKSKDELQVELAAKSKILAQTMKAKDQAIYLYENAKKQLSLEKQKMSKYVTQQKLSQKKQSLNQKTFSDSVTQTQIQHHEEQQLESNNTSEGIEQKNGKNYQKPKESQTNKKKVDKKEFSRALKITYMRRQGSFYEVQNK